MPKIILKGLLVFCILLVATFLMMEVFKAEFGTVDFFMNHGFFFLIFITLFPRLTLLFSSVPFGGLLWWLGLIICPRILVAALATTAYFRTNPLLVVIAWLVAISGETMEKYSLGRNRFHIRTFRFNDRATGGQHKVAPDDEAIEAEYKDLSS